MQKGVKTGIMTILIVAVTALLSWLQIGYSLDVSLQDQLCQTGGVTSDHIYIIGIDDKTLEKYGAVNTWDRKLNAELVEMLNANETDKPAVIGFDMLYSEGGDTEGDLRFAKACEDAGNVVVAMSYQFKERTEEKNGKIEYQSYSIQNRILPYPALQKVCDMGFANTVVGADGYVRRAMLYVEDEGEKQYSFAAKVYQKYQKACGEAAVYPKLDENHQCFFSYSGKSGHYSKVSMADVLDGSIDPKLFADSIVLVGAYAVGMQDAYAPAIAHGEQMYGVEIHSNIIQALLDGKTQQSIPRMSYAVIIGLIAGGFYLLIQRLKIIPSVICLLVLLVADITAVKVMYRQGITMPVILIAVVLILIFIAHLVRGYLEEILRRKQVINVFKQYVAPQVVDKISKDKDFKLVLGGENRHIACLFVDIRGFTTMSESLKPEEVVEILNEYLTLTTNSIFQNGGTLDKFVGDATMAVFNAPFDLEDYIYRAVCTARDMQAGAEEISKKFEKEYGKTVSFGIGIHCGNAVVGNIGCDFRMDYTAIGDTVNTAARLESNAKAGQILISRDVYEAVKERVEVTPVGEIPLKGKENGVFVYQIDGVK